MDPSTQDTRRWARGILRVVGLAASAYSIALAVHEAYLNRTAQPVPATVTSVAVTSDAERHGTPLYRPVVGFVYQAGGREYESARYAVTRRRVKDRQLAEAAAQQYAVGEHVTAYVPPSRPGEAFLRRETTWRLYWYALLFLVVAEWLRRTVYAASSQEEGQPD